MLPDSGSSAPIQIKLTAETRIASVLVSTSHTRKSEWRTWQPVPLLERLRFSRSVGSHAAAVSYTTPFSRWIRDLRQSAAAKRLPLLQPCAYLSRAVDRVCWREDRLDSFQQNRRNVFPPLALLLASSNSSAWCVRVMPDFLSSLFLLSGGR